MDKKQLAKVKAVFKAEDFYLRGKISKEAYFKKAGAFLECSQAFGQGGEYVCEYCLAKAVGAEVEEVAGYSKVWGKAVFSGSAQAEGEEDYFKEVK
jgi:hypothetical protein